ncbi:MAG: porin [Phycisphaerales bacterium JB038]
MDKRIVRLIAVAGAVTALPMMAQAGTEEAQLRARLAEMESENAALREAVGDRNLNDRQHEELQRLTAEAAGDPDLARASFFAAGSAGYDKGFFISSDDGSFKLQHNAQIQFRYVLNLQDNSSDDGREGFEMRRTKLKLKGHIYDDWHFAVSGGIYRNDGEFYLENAYIKRDLGDGWNVKFGQFKGPFLREELVSSAKQLLVERSLVNEYFNQDYTQGVQFGYENDQFRFHVMYNEGVNADNTGALMEDVEFAFSGRAEMLLNGDGDWSRFNDFTSPQDDEGFAALFGVGAHYQAAERGTGDGSGSTFNDTEVDWYGLTADASIECGGANAFASFVYVDAEMNPSGDAQMYGFTVQGGVYVAEDWELFGRYEWGDLDTSGVEDLSVVTVGFNHYIHGHNAKWTTDVGFGLDEISSPWSSSGAGWRSDASGEDGQIVARTQFQLLY